MNVIPANTEVQKSLFAKAKSGSLSSAYLFIGKEGIGKEALAIELCKVANSLQTDFEGVLKSGAMQYIHPLPRSIKPKRTGRPLDDLSDKQINEVRQLHSIKNKIIYKKIIPVGSGDIKIDQIRNAIAELHKSTSVQHRFVIVPDAERMNEQSANAFLKTLEEPPQNSTVILTTAKPARIIKTINSRCQSIRIDTPTPDELMSFIVNLSFTDNFSSDILQQAVFQSEGSILKAIEIIQGESEGYYSIAIEYLRSTLRTHNYQLNLSELINSDPKNYDKSQFRGFISEIGKILLRSKKIYEGVTLQYISPDEEKTIMKIANKYGSRITSKVFAALDRAIDMQESNVGKDLILLDLSMKLRELLLH